MTTPTLPTVAALRADEGLLRQVVGAVLEPGPYYHDCLWIMSPESYRANGPCHKCGRTPDEPSDYCSIPGLYDDELEVAAERLVKILTAIPVHQWYKPFLNTLRNLIRVDGDTVMLWLVATPTDRILCALLALGKARME